LEVLLLFRQKLKENKKHIVKYKKRERQIEKVICGVRERE
jgi:hypothetical protein